MKPSPGKGERGVNLDHRRERGSVSGRVTKSGRGVLGAHIVAFNMRTGQLIGGFSLDDDRRFVIGGPAAGRFADAHVRSLLR